MELTEHELIKSIQSGEISVCVIGIGRIGLPTALSFANSGLPTIGVDINSKLVEKINSKIFNVFERLIDTLSFSFMEGIGCVTPNATKVAPSQSNENAG